MRRVREAAQAAFHTHALTRHLPQQALTDWYTWARQQVHAFQRASSAVEGRGSRLRRDNWVSVRYAEELNSGKSSVLLQRADRHEILGQKPAELQRHS
jgi:hypothetical protein